MARIWASGFELNDASATGLEWSASSGSPTIQGTTVRSGSYALQITSLASGTAKHMRYQYQSEAAANYYFRFYLRIATLPSAENRIFVLNDSTTVTSSPTVWLTIDNSGVLKLYDEDGQITGTSTLTTGVWYNIEVHVNTVGGTGACIVEARVDCAATFASSSTRSIAATNNLTHIYVGGNLNGEAQTTGNWYFDDVAINDDTDIFCNSWCGHGSIIHLKPNAAGDNSGFTGAYTAIDEVTPNDATDTITTTTANAITDVNLEATPAAIGSEDKINTVCVGLRFTNSATNVTNGLRLKASSGGTVTTSANFSVVTAGTYQTNKTSGTPRGYFIDSYTQPGTSDPWTKATLDTAQIGITTDALSGGSCTVSTMWLLVEYQNIPSVALDTPTAGQTGVSLTPDLVFTGTDTTTNDIEYDVSLGKTLPLAYYALEANSNDSIGSSNGADTSVTYTTGKVSNGASYDGTNSYTTISNTIASLTSFSVSLWVKSSSFAADRKYVCRDESGGTNWAFYIGQVGASGKFSFGVQTGSAYREQTIDTIVPAPSTGVWYHLVLVWTHGTNSVMKGYINGQLAFTNTYTGEQIKANGSKEIRLGCLNSTTQRMTGMLDEVAIWGSALSEGDVQYLYNNGAGNTHPVYSSDIEKFSETPDATFTDVTNGADTHPFASGDQVKYTIQAGDTLANSTTYYWRVRGKDPTGSNIYGNWSAVRSFTTLAGATANTIQKSLKYTVVKSVSAVTKSLKYSVKTTPSTITKTLIYRVVKPSTIQKTLVYKVKSSVSAITKSLKYTVTSSVAAITKSLKYTVTITPSTITKSLKYSVITVPATTQKSLKYTVLKSPSITKGLVYYVLKTYSITKSLVYKVVPSLTIQKALIYKVTSPNTINKSLKYCVIVTPSTIQKSLTYNIQSTVTTYSIQKTLIYMVIKASSITKSLKYTTITAVSINKSLKYTIKSPVTIQKSLKYSVLTTPSTITKSLAYYVMKSISITKSLRYEVVSPVSIQKSLKYTIIANASIQKSLKYTALTTGSINKSLRYDVFLGSPTINKTLIYKIAKSISITKTLIYKVTAPATLQKSLKYCVFRSVSAITKNLSYYVIVSSNIQKSLRYIVVSPVTIQKSLTYDVVSVGVPHTIEKTLQYSVVKANSITKTLVYKVVAPQSLTKSLKYCVVTTKNILGSPPSFLDKTSNNNDLTEVGGVISSSDTAFAESSSSISLDGNKYLEITDANQTGLDLGNTFSIQAWIKPTTVSGWQEIVMKDQENNRQFMFFLINSLLYVEYADASGNETFWNYNLGDISNVWTHLTATVTVNTQTAQFYVNGSPVSPSRILANATSINNGSAPVTIGIRKYFGDPEYVNAFKGLLDDIRIWNIVLTPTQVSNNYNTKLVGNETGLVANWEWDAGLKRLAYYVVKSYTKTKSLSYSVIAPHTITKSLKYSILTGFPLTKSLKYCVKTSATPKTKSLTYQVVSSKPALTKQLVYAIRTSSTIQKSLSYIVPAVYKITKTLKYTVISSQYKTKRLIYRMLGQKWNRKNKGKWEEDSGSGWYNKTTGSWETGSPPDWYTKNSGGWKFKR